MSPESEPAPNEPQPAATQSSGAPAAEPSAPGRPDRTLLAILAAIAVLVIVALIVVFTRGEPAPLDEATPSGVVQRYSAAVIAGDEAAATAYLSDSAKSGCIKEVPRMGTDNLRVTLVSTTERAATADVRVLITVSEGGGPFGSSEYQMEDAFDLVKAGDKWLIERAPWQLTVCQPAVVK